MFLNSLDITITDSEGLCVYRLFKFTVSMREECSVLEIVLIDTDNVGIGINTAL